MSGQGVAALSLERVRVRYSNGALGVLDASLEARAGEIVAVVGPNGAGKTTTVRAASGFLRTEAASVVQGSVKVFGREVTNAPPHVIASTGVAFVPERQKIFPDLSVRKNLYALKLQMSRSQREKKLQEVLQTFPALQPHLDGPAGMLSGGQQQMLALARCLMREPKVVIIDEITLGLHRSMHATLEVALQAIAAIGAAVVVVDESTDFALNVADRVYRVDNGVVHQEDQAAEESR